MKMTLLGTGTSHGIPCIACQCPVCLSKDKRDKRLRCSAYLTHKNKDKSQTNILIDIGPEFRIQALKYKIKKVDAVLLTHSHADHLHGLDDIRIFSHTISSSHLTNPELGKETEGDGICIYGNKSTLKDVKSRFSYVFNETQIGGGKPKLRLERSRVMKEKNPEEFKDVRVLRIPLLHGKLKSTGWLFSVTGKDKQRHSIAYLTDLSYISEKSIQKIVDNGGIIDHLVIDALKIEKHQTHFSFLQAMEVAERIGSLHTWFIHICHRSSHVEIQEYIKEHLDEFPALLKIVENGGSVEPAWDGLTLEV